ncbi:MAG TPA: glycosyltransferase family 4 protein [Puia sp.]|nr:glycosyltransferase family 4 protein [Puia sp.]
MNILWISYYPLHQNEHPAPWITTLAKETVSQGHSLTILTVSSRIFEVKKIQSVSGYEVIVVPYKGGIFHLLSFFNSRINALKSFLNDYDQNIDVIHVHGTEHQYASSLLRIKKKIPFIISVQGIMSLYKKELKKRLSMVNLFWTLSSFYEKKEIRNSHNFFCRTHWDRSFIHQMNKNSEFFMNWELIRPEFFQYENDYRGRDLIFMAGASFLKALDICLQVFDQLLAGIDIKLHIVGTCSLKDVDAIRIKYQLSRLNSENIILYGQQDAAGICEVYMECFCLYHPSLIDNSPNTVCEAQVAGLPVVATNVGGLSSLIKHTETGLLVDKNNVHQHAETLFNLYQDDKLRRYLGQNSMCVARKRHDKVNIVNKTIDAYRKIMHAAS